MVAIFYIAQGYATSKILAICGISKSSFYYQPLTQNNYPKGVSKSKTTNGYDGRKLSNSKVVQWIKAILLHEFVDYGYLKITYYLQHEKQLNINHKKVYRLMKENKLLNLPMVKIKNTKRWVKDLVPKPTTAFSYWEFDIKFIYIHHLGRYAPMLSIIDVFSRYLIGWIMQWSIKKEDVKYFFQAILEDYELPKKVYVRCDNGSQFESTLVREYLISKHIIQEFTQPATPEQNAHIESYHSIISRAVCNRYEFKNLVNATEIFTRWETFYNEKRIHSGINYLSPKKYLETLNIIIPKKYKLKK